MSKKFVGAIVFGCVVGLPQIASAGIHLNALGGNGIHLNALGGNAGSSNGIHLNGARVNADHTWPNAPAQEVPDVPQREYVASITLPGGRTLIAR